MPFTMVPKNEMFVNEFIKANGKKSLSQRYFGATKGPADVPNAFVVTLREEVLKAHFHPVDQFQVLLGGPGSTYRRTQVGDMMVHYADAYSTYGPFRGEDPPLRILTLRTVRSDFTAFMPDSRDKMLWRGERLMDEAFSFLKPDEVPPAGEVVTSTIFERAEDGLEALALTAGPGAVIDIPGTAGTSGQYIWVADGSVTYEGKDCPIESLGWQDREEDGVQVTAGADGTRLFVMRFPWPSTTVSHLDRVKTEALV